MTVSTLLALLATAYGVTLMVRSGIHSQMMRELIAFNSQQIQRMIYEGFVGERMSECIDRRHEFINAEIDDFLHVLWPFGSLRHRIESLKRQLSDVLPT